MRDAHGDTRRAQTTATLSKDFETADPGQDPRGAPDLMPLWPTILDSTPEGRGADWYPKLKYSK